MDRWPMAKAHEHCGAKAEQEDFSPAHQGSNLTEVCSNGKERWVSKPMRGSLSPWESVGIFKPIQEHMRGAYKGYTTRFI